MAPPPPLLTTAIRTFRILPAALLFAALAPSPRALAGCCVADPSALDIHPEAVPLLVAHDRPAGELVLSWEAHASGSLVWQGDLLRLWDESVLNDAPAGPGEPNTLRLPTPPDDAYFLVSGDCDGLFCTRGRDSNGADRGTPDCAILERGDIWSEPARCLRGDRGVVRDAAEYDLFAACFGAVGAPAPPAPGEALVWMTDHSNAACGSCLEITCARGISDTLVVEPHGAPYGDCDAFHDGGAWALVPDFPVITFLEEMPPLPEYGSCR